MPPPLLHTRSGNQQYENDRPQTPTSVGFTSPFATPQGSPSKKQLPPGANDLPNVFDNAMKLAPASPTKASRQPLSPHSPRKGNRQDPFDESSLAPGSPLTKSNSENTPPGLRIGKDATFNPNQAALSRQEPYQSRETSDQGTTRSRFNLQRGLTPEEQEKLQLPKVKRLANVTQLSTSITVKSAKLYSSLKFLPHLKHQLNSMSKPRASI
ncbi:MAG: hypothetical protein Q9183_003710 [Haloplaca sp. 2 TL-2023]